MGMRNEACRHDVLKQESYKLIGAHRDHCMVQHIREYNSMPCPNDSRAPGLDCASLIMTFLDLGLQRA